MNELRSQLKSLQVKAWKEHALAIKISGEVAQLLVTAGANINQAFFIRSDISALDQGLQHLSAICFVIHI